MIKSALKTTSAIALCTALSTPPSFAQDTAADEDLPVCNLTGPFPCMLEDGTVIEDAAELAAERAEDATEDNEADEEDEEPPVDELPPDEAQVVDEPPEDASEVEGLPEELPEPDDIPDDASVVDEPAEDEPVLEDLPEDETLEDELPAESDDVMEATEPPLETPAEDETVFEEPADDAATDDEEVTDEEILDEVIIDEEVTDEEVTDEDILEEEVIDEDVTDEEIIDEDATDADVVDDTVTDETVTDETVTDDVTDESAADDAMADDDAAEDETASSEDEAITDAEAEEMPEDAAEPVIEGTAAAEAEAEAETAGDDDLLLETGEGEVTTEEVTEETSRSSGEEFETTSSGDTAAQVEQSGMSNFEKALLLGLGTIAVGAVLANGARIVNNTGDRIIIEQPDGTYRVLKNDDVILRRPGSEVRTRTYEDGSTRTVITHPNGVRIATVRAADGTALKRVRVMPNGDRYVLFDDTLEVEPVRTVQRRTPTQDIETTDSDALREALIASMNADVGRSFSLGQIRAFKQVRELAPKIEVRDITFATDSAAIRAEQAERLADLGLAIADVIAEVPDAVFLVEGHTDAVGAASYNLALSDRRAESVALALTEYFDVPPENLVTQGYGESELKVLTASSERANRRVVVRNITPLLR